MERSDDVLWSLSGRGEGIVLHQIVSRRFMELDDHGYTLWSLLDGARTVEEVLGRCGARGTAMRRLRSTIDTMLAHGFIVPAESRS